MKHNEYRMLIAIFAICTSFYFISCSEKDNSVVSSTDDSSQFVTLTDVVPDAILEISSEAVDKKVISRKILLPL